MVKPRRPAGAQPKDMALSGRYQIHKWLKDGLYGPILQCQDLLNGHQMVAVKIVSLLERHRTPVLPPRTASATNPKYHESCQDPGNSYNTTHNFICDQAAQERHIIEILQSTCGHPNVLHIHQMYEEEKGTAQLIVMEFCSGGDLQELLERQPLRRFPESQALQFFAQIVAGVQFLHANDIAHRDLSLENVLVTDQNVCKIGDFGLSVHSTLTSHEMVGKRFYMAPEVAFGEEYDPQLADLWSLGIILFLMLTGLPLVDFDRVKRCPATAAATAAAAVATGPEQAACRALRRHQEDVNDMTLAFIKHHGVSKLLALWGLDQMISSKTMELLDGILQVVPHQRLRVEAMLQRLPLDAQAMKPSNAMQSQLSGLPMAPRSPHTR